MPDSQGMPGVVAGGGSWCPHQQLHQYRHRGLVALTQRGIVYSTTGWTSALLSYAARRHNNKRGDRRSFDHRLACLAITPPVGGEPMTDTAAREGIAAPTLQVIGAGFGRTGTLSMREALVRLGFGPCAHMRENFEHPERFAMWAEVLRRKGTGEPIDWCPLLAGFRAIVDWPGAYFWRELTAAHPNAKVILTVRDPDRWYQSCLSTIFRMRARADTSL